MVTPPEVVMPPSAVKFTAPAAEMSAPSAINNVAAESSVTIPFDVVVTELFNAIIPPVTTFKPAAVL